MRQRAGARPVIHRIANRAEARSVEARHRAVVQWGLGLLLVLSLTTTTGQPASVAASVLSGCREILAQCLIVLRATGAPLHWVPLVLLGAGLLYAVVDRIRLSRRVTRLLRRHSLRDPGQDEPIGRIAAELDCLSMIYLVVGIAPNPAFTAGILRPHIYLAEVLQYTLTPAELRAVCRHELHHVRHRDPLRFAVLRFAAKMLFWLPLIGTLSADLMEDAEIRADDFAADGSDPLDVASALIKIGRSNAKVVAGMDAGMHAEVHAGVAALGGFRSLDRRVRRLADECATTRWSPGWRPMLFSAAALVMLWGSAAFAPQRRDLGMTMRFGERCSHSMPKRQGKCPECDHEQAKTMPGCER